MEIASNPHNGTVLMNVVIREWSGLYTTAATDKSRGARSIEIATCDENLYSKMIKQGRQDKMLNKNGGKGLFEQLGCGGGHIRQATLKERRGQDLVRSDEPSATAVQISYSH
ncbi:LOW QUALITY PROTEIN: hypothetical protein IFM46972_01767 [Aspergillus udagawae]|uniref:Uncharacterized protein n=1 Tax=Aspergillus udagawae TaxID=91492 RepID=A0A8H3N453_9EURO|nr:LOW QUALITY PROTEIN: hypothetical protein IFM46972_01767 [Aspergillus udagawae]